MGRSESPEEIRESELSFPEKPKQRDAGGDGAVSAIGE